jgi:hypothetical protein
MNLIHCANENEIRKRWLTAETQAAQEIAKPEWAIDAFSALAKRRNSSRRGRPSVA